MEVARKRGAGCVWIRKSGRAGWGFGGLWDIEAGSMGIDGNSKNIYNEISLPIMMKIHEDEYISEQISKFDLPSAQAIQQINLMFLMNAKKAQKSASGERPIYNLYDRSFHQMKNYILKLPSEYVSYIEKIMTNFPDKSSIYDQCAYYMRAFSRAQIFLDANHRTGFFSLANILKKKGIIIEADAQEITALFEYIKGQGWIEQGEMMVNLKQKDDELNYLSRWFKMRLKLG